MNYEEFQERRARRRRWGTALAVCGFMLAVSGLFVVGWLAVFLVVTGLIVALVGGTLDEQ